MREVSGQLTKLGSGTVSMNQVGKSFIKYDLIEIGDTILQNVRTARSLSNYLSDGLGSVVTLYVQGSVVIGVELSGGKIYYWKRSLVAPIFMLIPSAMGGAAVAGMTQSGFFGLLGFIAVYAIAARTDILHIMGQSKLAAKGGVGLKS